MSETRFPTKSHAAAPPCRTTRWWDECGPQEERVARLSCRSHVKRRIRSVEALHTISSPDPSDYYVYGPGGVPIEQIASSTGVATYLYTDQLGSVVMAADSSGTVTGTQSFTAYGSLATRSGSIESPFGFAGGYTDVTGLIYLVNRYYDPATGQFLSVDPLVGVTGEAYSYCGGNPLNYTDPLGAFSLNPLQWLLDLVNVFADAINQDAQTTIDDINFEVGQEKALEADIANLEANLRWAAYPTTICNDLTGIASDNANILTIKKHLQNDRNILDGISNDQANISEIYSLIAYVSGIGAVYACIVGIAATLVSLLYVSMAAAVAAVLTETGTVALHLSEVANDILGCKDAFS